MDGQTRYLKVKNDKSFLDGVSTPPTFYACRRSLQGQLGTNKNRELDEESDNAPGY